MKQTVKKEDIRVETDALGHRYHVVYSKSGVAHKIAQLQDAIDAVKTGAYFTEKPVKK